MIGIRHIKWIETRGQFKFTGFELSVVKAKVSPDDSSWLIQSGLQTVYSRSKPVY